MVQSVGRDGVSKENRRTVRPGDGPFCYMGQWSVARSDVLIETAPWSQFKGYVFFLSLPNLYSTE